MIRCNIFKGKIRNDNFVNAGRDAQPRRDDGLVLDHGNTGIFILHFCTFWKSSRATSSIVHWLYLVSLVASFNNLYLFITHFTYYFNDITSIIYANLVILATPVRITGHQVVSLGHLGGFVTF